MAAATVLSGAQACVQVRLFFDDLHRRCKKLKYQEIELQWLGLTSLISSAT
jgi:hypothetical protein